MNKVTAVKVIVKGYFFSALAASFSHLVIAAYKGGLQGHEAWSVPFLIDGIAIMGLIMRGSEFSERTRSIGFKVQCGAGLLSLAGNIYAAHNLGGAVYGFAIVALFVLAEWLSDNIVSAKDAADKAAKDRRNAQAKARRTAKTASNVTPIKRTRKTA